MFSVGRDDQIKRLCRVAASSNNAISSDRQTLRYAPDLAAGHGWRRLPLWQRNLNRVIGTVHVVFAVAALVVGATVFCRRKGDRRHRILGYFYPISLLAVNANALAVYEDSAGVGPFHILAVVSLVTLISGFIPALLRRPVSWWLDLHAYFMSWSYVGLVAAGVAQIATMASSLPARFAVGLPSILIVVVGGVLIHTRVPKILAAIVSGRHQVDKNRGGSLAAATLSQVGRARDQG